MVEEVMVPSSHGTHLISLLLVLSQWLGVGGHARFLEPPSRASMWRMGFSAPVDYQDHEGNCGGLFHQWLSNGGRCGLCGDRWDVWPRPHEEGGRYASGDIVRRYQQGQVISSVIEVTTAHQGYMEFRLCKLSSDQVEATQTCLNENILQLADGTGSKYPVSNRSEMARVKLQLPDDLTCQHCVIQWRYRTGNNWGVCGDGSSRMGCGPQEEFRGCSDVSISSDEQQANDLDDPFFLQDLHSAPFQGDFDVSESGSFSSEGTSHALHSDHIGVIDTRTSTEGNFIDTVDLEEVDITQLGENFEKGLAEVFDGSDNTIDSTNAGFRSTTLRDGRLLESAAAASVPEAREGSLCHAVRIWATVPGMDSWCETSCRAHQASCPSGMCRCGADEASNQGADTLKTKRTERKKMPRSSLEVIEDRRSGSQRTGQTQARREDEVKEPKTKSPSDGVQRSDIKALLTELAELREQSNTIQQLRKQLSAKQQAPDELQTRVNVRGRQTGVLFNRQQNALDESKSFNKPTLKLDNLIRTNGASTIQRPTNSKPKPVNAPKKLEAKLIKSRGHRLLQLRKLRSKKPKSIRLKLSRKSKKFARKPKSSGQWQTHIECKGVTPWRHVTGINRWCRQQCPGRGSCPVTVCVCSSARLSVSHPTLSGGTNTTLLQISQQPERGTGRVVVGTGADKSQIDFKSRSPGFLFFLQPLDQTASGSQNRRSLALPPSNQRAKLLQRIMELLRKRNEDGREVVLLGDAPNSAEHPQSNEVETHLPADALLRQVALLRAATGSPTAADKVELAGTTVSKPAVAAGCRGVGKWRHSFAMDYWCEVNCSSEKVKNCPKSVCECRGYARLQTL